jgi:D-aminopeptidase
MIATDAPLMPHQCKRLARRVGMGIARGGTISHNGSGDIFIAFSTANKNAWAVDAGTNDCRFLPNHTMDPLFQGVVEATDEAIIDSMVANETMVGRDGTTVIALPHDRLQELLKQHGRLEEV